MTCIINYKNLINWHCTVPELSLVLPLGFSVDLLSELQKDKF